MRQPNSRNLLKFIPFLVTGLLLASGITYGLWSETLLIDGIVYTGEVYGEWTSCICNDNGLDPLPTPWPYKYPIPARKDVGKTICTIDQDDPRILHLTIQNGYPSYWGNCEVHFANTGSVPVIIRGYTVVPKNFTLATRNGADDGQIWVRYWDGVGAQMEPCPHETCEQASSIQFHVEQPAEENKTYNFDVYVCLAQWNENATMKECLDAAPVY